jgi:hypothetical protein
VRLRKLSIDEPTTIAEGVDPLSEERVQPLGVAEPPDIKLHRIFYRYSGAQPC